MNQEFTPTDLSLLYILNRDNWLTHYNLTLEGLYDPTQGREKLEYTRFQVNLNRLNLKLQPHCLVQIERGSREEGILPGYTHPWLAEMYDQMFSIQDLLLMDILHEYHVLNNETAAIAGFDPSLGEREYVRFLTAISRLRSRVSDEYTIERVAQGSRFNGIFPVYRFARDIQEEIYDEYH